MDDPAAVAGRVRDEVPLDDITDTDELEDELSRVLDGPPNEEAIEAVASELADEIGGEEEVVEEDEVDEPRAAPSPTGGGGRPPRRRSTGGGAPSPPAEQSEGSMSVVDRTSSGFEKLKDANGNTRYRAPDGTWTNRYAWSAAKGQD